MNKNRQEGNMKIAGLIMLFLLSHPNLIQAQADQLEKSFTKLIQAKTLKCVWEKGVSSKWKEGLAVIEESKMAGFTYDSIDLQKGMARFIANAGAADIMVITSMTGIVFIEQTGSGNNTFTTVYSLKADPIDFMEPRETFYAVHSRHMNFFSNTPISSQYYGKCMIWG
jgi:hypothetical protein